MDVSSEVRCQDAYDLLGSLDEGTVPLIVTDPPYGVAYHSNFYRDGNPHDPVQNDWNFQVGSFFAVAERCLKESAAMYVFTRWDVYPLWQREVPHTLTLKNCIVWRKNNHSAGDLKGDYGNQYELLMFIVKGRHLRRGHRWSNVWDFPRVPHRKLRCATEKPLALVERIVRASSDRGDLVVDPFCGSGTTGEAARNCGRSFLLGDVDARMVEASCERLDLEVPGLPGRATPMPECPVFSVEPPEPSLWGVHPEDLAHAIGKDAEAVEPCGDGRHTG